MTSFISDNFHSITDWVSSCFHSSEISSEKPEFQELIRRLTPKESQQIHRKLSRVTDKNITEFVAALSGPEWSSDPIFKNSDFPYFALAAVSKGKINCHQFATIMNFWVKFAKEGRAARQLSLFLANGTRNQSAEIILRQHLEQRKDTLGQLSEVQFNAFYEKMKQAPVSEQTLLYEDFKDELDATEMTENLAQIGFDIFYCHNNTVLLPSATLFETYLAAKYPTSAVKLNPVLGLSSLEDIRQNGLNGTRDVAIHFPEIELPEEADKNKAPGYAFTFHDYYHAVTASAIPDKYRKKLMEIADIAQRISQQTGKTLAASLSERIFDLEATHYRLRADGQASLEAIAIYRKNPENFLFWNFLIENTYALKNKIAIDPTLEERILIRSWILQFPVNEGYREGVQDFLNQKMAFLDGVLVSLDERDFSEVKDPWIVEIKQEKKNHILHTINEAWKERLSWDTGIVQQP